MNCTEVTVTGNFRTQGNAVVTWDCIDFYDILIVNGNVVFDGGNINPTTVGGGELWVQGNFTQLATNSVESFHNAAVTVYFFGTNPQTISFATPGIGIGVAASHFFSIGFMKPSGTVTLASDVYATENLTSGISFPTNIAGTGSGFKLSVGGLNVNTMTLDHVLFTYNGDPNTPSFGSFVAFDNVLFTNTYAPTETQFTIIHPGGVSPFTINSITFNTTPTTGGYYMSVTDSAVDPNTLTIVMLSASPATPGAFVLTGGGAVVSW